MTFDVPFRHHQAMDAATLPTITVTLQAMTKALADCRNAGVDPDSDPAMVLLARHMAVVSTNRAPRSVLLHACRRRIDALRRFPTLLSIAIRGVAYDQVAKERFHMDARAELEKLASALHLIDGSYTVISSQGTTAESGYVILAAPEVAVVVRVGGRYEGREVAYRAVVNGIEQPNRHAGMAELLNTARFAERLTRELNLTAPATARTEPALIAA